MTFVQALRKRIDLYFILQNKLITCLHALVINSLKI